MDLTGYTMEQLQALRVEVLTAIERLQTIESAPEQADRLADRYLHATGALADDGETVPAWLPPAEAKMPYPKGAEVTHGGKTWRSQIPRNVWEPGDTADPQSYRWWAEVVPVEDGDTDPDATPEWDGAGHEYAVGDRVTYDGSTYEVLQAHTSQPGWTPTVVPALWTKVEISTTASATKGAARGPRA